MSSDFELAEATIDGIHEKMRAGVLTSRRLVELYLERIESYDRGGPQINSIVTVNDRVMEEADRCDRHLAATGELLGPLHGIPVAVKDQVETDGIPTMYGCIAFKSYVPRRDATIVTRLRATGAVILAKTTMSDFATSWHGISSATGVTKNPHAPDYDPGGSSSGSGAAVAANFATIGIAEDTGGSVRVPAAFNNLVGVRVTTGLISRMGLSPLVAWQDTAGPLTRTVKDAAVMLDVLVGHDPADPLTAMVAASPGVGGYVRGLRAGDLRGIRLGVLRQTFGPDQDVGCRAVNALIDAALADLRSLGADVVDPVAIPHYQAHMDATDLYLTISHTDINRYLASLPGSPFRSLEEICERGLVHPLNGFLPEIARRPILASDDPEYTRRVVARGEFQRAMLNRALEDGLDAFVCPSVRIPPPSRAEIFDPDAGPALSSEFPTNTEIAPRAWLPAVSVPAGFTDLGLPVGLELMGKPFQEVALLNMALAYEQATHHRRPPDGMP